jgi:hypothetical protein
MHFFTFQFVIMVFYFSSLWAYLSRILNSVKSKTNNIEGERGHSQLSNGMWVGGYQTEST